MKKLPFRALAYALLIVSTVHTWGCSDSVRTEAPKGSNVPAAIALIPGNDGIVVPSAVKHESLTLTWTQAEVQGSVEVPEYRLYWSRDNKLQSVADIEAAGTPVGDWSVDLTSLTVEGLYAGTTYHFNVLVRIPEETAAYSPVEVATLEADAPIPGGGGALTATVLSASSVRLTWEPASDDLTTGDALEYQAYSRANGPIYVLADVTGSGIAHGAWASGITQATVTGLDDATEYGFNVLVRDEHGALAAYSGLVSTTPDATPPAVTNSTLTFSNLKATSFTVSWLPSTDNVSPSEGLEYQVVYSKSGNIDGVNDAYANGTTASGWITDSTAAMSGLMPETNYFITVLVRDAVGNESAYTMTSQQTGPALWMYSTGAFNGNLGGRSGADAKCAAAAAKPSTCTNARAFLSVSSTDELRDMTLNYGISNDRQVVSPNGTVLATHYFDLLDGAIMSTLNNAGVVGTQFWWSGSGDIGQQATIKCLGWTTADAAEKAMAGSYYETTNYIAGVQSFCSSSRPIVCVCD